MRLRASVQPDAWCEELVAETGSFRPLPGGTLNLSLAGRCRDGTAACFKTHLTEAGRTRLRREAGILTALYGERLVLRYVSTVERDWLIMALLAPFDPNSNSAVCPDWIDATISHAETLGRIHPLDEGFSSLLQAAKKALIHLTDIGEITTALAACLQDDLHHLASWAETFPPHPCHGDLGPRNIMKDRYGLILLDWEDVFLGVRGYDWIFWLSFFSNRHLLTRDHLLKSGLPERSSQAILLAILLLKCELSLRSGTITGHNMPIERRLSEAIIKS